jgi:PAS domain S-box-containing protein
MFDLAGVGGGTHSLPSPSRLGEFRLDSAGSLLDIDETGARMLGFPSAVACLAASRGQVFATDPADPAAGAAMAILDGPTRLVADCRGAAGRRRCQLYARGDDREVAALFAPLDEEEPVRAPSLAERLAARLGARLAAREAELQHAADRLARDGAELRRSEARLQESEARFRHMADALPQIIWTALPSGEVDYVNSRGAEYAGVPAEQGLENGWLEFVHPEDRPRIWSDWNRATSSGETLDSEYRLRRSDGVYRWQLVRALAMRDPQGVVVRWFGTSTDVEDQRLAQRVMQEEDRRKNDFLAMLSHELRNPLTPIQNAAGLLRRVEPGSPEFDRALTILERQLRLMVRLIDDLLDLSRITHGKVLLKKERIDLVAVVRSLLDDRRESLEADKLVLEVALPQEPLWVRADLSRAAQAVGNLLDNAQKYTSSGGVVRVEVRAEGGEAAVIVKDSGVGLSPAALERIFVPFVQVGDPAAGRRGGLGLGLSLVRSLAELHGGSVQAHSEGVGRGSVFAFRIPLAGSPAAAGALPPPTRDAMAESPEGREGREGRKILVVEDNADAARSLQLMLELDGHHVEVVSSGEEGLTRARTMQPDVVLSDVGLPGISGYALARALRADPAVGAHLVAITGYGQVEDREEALSSGFEHHLTKPFDHQLLHQLLAELRQR